MMSTRPSSPRHGGWCCPRGAYGGGALALALVCALAIAVTLHPGPLPGEVAYVRWFQTRGEPVPTLADVVRATTGTEAALVVAVVPGAWLVWRDRRAGLFAVAIAAATMLVLQPALKELIDRPRPAADVVEVRADHSSKSFPSGHSMSTTTVWGAAAGFAWYRGRRYLAGAALVPIGATFVASAVHGVHWPSDALAGTSLGAGAAAAIVSSVTRAVATPAR